MKDVRAVFTGIHSDKRELGFSLIELLVAMAILAVMATLSMTAFRGYQKSQAHRNAMREVTSVLRNAQVKAVTEATTYQCKFAADSLEIYRDGTVPPDAANKVKTYSLSVGLNFVSSSPYGFTHPDGIRRPNCLFYARGSATAGEVLVRRTDTDPDRDFGVRLEGLTARVSYDD